MADMQATPDYARIKRNISKMIAQGAPETDIDAYVSSENVTPEMLRSGAPPRGAGLIDSASTQDPANTLGIPVFNRGATPDEAQKVREQTIARDYENLPWYGKAAQATDDTARLMLDGLSAGFLDKFADGDGPSVQRQATRDARTRAGWAGTAAEVVGMAMPMGMAAKAGLSAQAALSGGKGLAGLGARTGGAGVDNAAMGALSAMGHDEDATTGAIVGGLTGAAGNVAGEALSGIVGKAAGMFNKQPKLLDLDALKASGQAAYARAENAGIVIKPEALQRVNSEVANDLAEFGYHPDLQPRIKTVLAELDRVSQGNATLKGIDVVRRIADSARKSLDPSEKALGNQIISRIDDMVTGLKQTDVVMGNVKAGVSALNDARNLWGRFRKSEMVNEAVQKGERRAASTGSGGNTDNAVRQNIRAILDNPKKRRGFTPDELQAMETVVRGTTPQNLARLVGKLSPQGNGLMAALGIGGTFVNPMAAAIPAAGYVAKVAADRATPANVAALDKIIRAGGTKSAASAAPNALQRLAASERDRLIRLLSAAGYTLAQGRQ